MEKSDGRNFVEAEVVREESRGKKDEDSKERSISRMIKAADNFIKLYIRATYLLISEV